MKTHMRMLVIALVTLGASPSAGGSSTLDANDCFLGIPGVQQGGLGGCLDTVIKYVNNLAGRVDDLMGTNDKSEESAGVVSTGSVPPAFHATSGNMTFHWVLPLPEEFLVIEACSLLQIEMTIDSEEGQTKTAHKLNSTQFASGGDGSFRCSSAMSIDGGPEYVSMHAVIVDSEGVTQDTHTLWVVHETGLSAILR